MAMSARLRRMRWATGRMGGIGFEGRVGRGRGGMIYINFNLTTWLPSPLMIRDDVKLSVGLVSLTQLRERKEGKSNRCCFASAQGR